MESQQVAKAAVMIFKLNNDKQKQILTTINADHGESINFAFGSI